MKPKGRRNPIKDFSAMRKERTIRHCKIAFGLALTPLLLGCGGHFSPREQLIRSHLPEPYKSHSSGIVVHPTEWAADQAIKLGYRSWHDAEELLQYAYRLKPDEHAYVDVHTPLFYIAKYSFECAGAFKELDPDTVAALRKSVYIGISASPTYINAPGEPSLILLRDGERIGNVKPNRTIALLEGLESTMFYTVDELIRPGVYEVVFRVPKTDNRFIGGIAVKYKISLSGIR